MMDLRGDKLPGDIQVIRYNAREAISRPYEVDVEISTADASWEADSCLRSRAIMTIIDDQAGQRCFDGVIDRAEFAYFTGTLFHHKIRLRPTVASLAHREDNRIYQEKSIVDVIKEVFSAAGIDNVEWQLQGTYSPREYVVQYRETELNFVQRLMEDEGIFYFFRHTFDGHKMIVADDPGAFAPADDAPEVIFSMGQSLGGEPIQDFSRTRSLRTTAAHLRDYDFEKPQQKPDAQIPAEDKWPMLFYEYPGGFTKSASGNQRAKARLSERRRDADVVRGTSRAIGLRCGVPFKVDGAAQDCLNGEFVITELHTWGEQTLESGGANEACHNEFSGIQKDAPYAPARTAKKPVIRGIQTAVVTGASSEEQAIHVDKYGRIKVRFHWDRVGQFDDKSSIWLRVAQSPMGGSMILPRVSWEVSVAYFNGDPDQPFVLGRVYNAGKTPPYSLPGSQAQGSIKSMSSPGAAGHNEIMMADSGGSQGWNMHAQKDLNIRIEHDKNETIAVDEKSQITVNVSNSVGSNESLDVGADMSLDVGDQLTHKVGGSMTIDVGGNETDNAISNYIEHIGGARSYDVGGNMTVINNSIMQEIAGNLTRTVGAVELVASIASITDEIGADYTENVGAVKAEIMKGMSSENVGGSKSQTYAAAELHLVKGNFDSASDASVTNLVGGLHYAKVAGDYSVKAPLIALIGAIGDFKGGGSNLKLGGGPVVLKGSEVKIETALLVKLGGSLTMGA